jgi:hypothetical protein
MFVEKMLSEYMHTFSYSKQTSLQCRRNSGQIVRRPILHGLKVTNVRNSIHRPVQQAAAQEADKQVNLYWRKSVRGHQSKTSKMERLNQEHRR